MNRLTLIAFLTASALAGAASAAPLAVGETLGKDAEAVRATLVSQGYEVRKVEAEDGKIEAYVVKDGKMAEVYVDAASGAVSKIEAKN